MSQSSITKETVQLEVPGSSLMGAYVARPASGGPHPALMMFQEAFGVNPHTRDVAERFAARGYVAIAPELFHRTAPAGFEGSYEDFSAVKPHYQAVTNETAEADARAAYEWLCASPHVQSDKISCVGFCLGGRVSFLANSILPMRSAVSFYGGGIAPALLDRASRLHGPALLVWGGLDKNIKPEHRRAAADALDSANKSHVSVEFSNAGHGFFCDARSSYEPNAARQAWALTLEFLRS
jgi:carboxymethylenebutenolidase